MSHPEATHSDQRPASEALASNRDESDEMDRAETVVYQALADNLMGRLNRGPQWNTIEQIMASLHDEARNILAALKAARIAIVPLPEGVRENNDDGDWWTDFPGVGLYVPVVFDGYPDEVQIRAGAWCDEPLSVTEARELAAGILAAADAAEAFE